MNKLLNLIGLAKKAGKLEVGEEPVGAAARSKHARLILMTSAERWGAHPARCWR